MPVATAGEPPSLMPTAATCFASTVTPGSVDTQSSAACITCRIYLETVHCVTSILQQGTASLIVCARLRAPFSAGNSHHAVLHIAACIAPWNCSVRGVCWPHSGTKAAECWDDEAR